MLLEVPEKIIRNAEVNATDLRIAMAVQLYADNRIDYSDACELAGLPSREMARELILRQITVQQYPLRKERERIQRKREAG